MDNKYNFAWVLSLVTLIGFSYFTFMGLDYWQGGKLLLPIVIILTILIIIPGCVYVMCMSKSTRWQKIGKIGQYVFGGIVLLVMLFAACPFTNFLGVVESQDELVDGVKNTCKAAVSLDDTYKAYVDKRVADYKSSLELISKGKNSNPTQYKECIEGASGSDDKEKIENLTKSLRNKLLPEDTQSVADVRHDWINQSNSIVVWNPLAPANIEKISDEVSGWTADYDSLSNIAYKGEETQPFLYKEFDNQLAQLTSTYREFHLPSILSVLITLVCFMIMLLPYFVTERDIASISDSNTSKGGKVVPNSDGNLFNKG